MGDQTPLTASQLQILQHSLGVDKHGQGRQYRNHFCTGPGTTDWPDCQALVVLGLMRVHPPSPITGGSHLFNVTAAGIDAVALQSPAPPRLTRSQQRYRDYRASDCDMSFIEWLRWKTWHDKEISIYGRIRTAEERWQEELEVARG